MNLARKLDFISIINNELRIQRILIYKLQEFWFVLLRNRNALVIDNNLTAFHTHFILLAINFYFLNWNKF